MGMGLPLRDHSKGDVPRPGFVWFGGPVYVFFLAVPSAIGSRMQSHSITLSLRQHWPPLPTAKERQP